MTYDPKIHHRRSIRLKGYDYSQPGAYFITICTYQKQPWFGEIRHAQMHLNQLGNIVAQEWIRTYEIRLEIILDEWIIMPNHLHGIIIISSPVRAPHPNPKLQFCRQSNSIPSIIAGFKSATTKRINEQRETPKVPLWQRNYYETIVQNSEQLDNIREYIQNNPVNWHQDPENKQYNPLWDLPF